MSADFMASVTAWLKRHPVQSPPQDPSYVPNVMGRVREPAPAYRWVVRPRMAWAVATAAVCAMALVAVRQPSRSERLASRMTQDLEQSLAVMAEVGELDSLADAEQDAVLLDQLMLAEAQRETDEELSIEETLSLLSQVEEGAVQNPNAGAESADELLRDLEILDQHDIASS